MMDWQEQQKQVARGVTDGTVLCAEYEHGFIANMTGGWRKRQVESMAGLDPYRNQVLEEVALQFDMMPALGDTASSFAAFVRRMKR